jgi:hypothetical protein
MAGANEATSGRRSEEIPLSTTVNTETLNFKVTTQFKKDFKGYAVSQGLTMVELLKEGFELSKQKRKH